MSIPNNISYDTNNHTNTKKQTSIWSITRLIKLTIILVKQLQQITAQMSLVDLNSCRLYKFCDRPYNYNQNDLSKNYNQNEKIVLNIHTHTKNVLPNDF